MGNSISLTANEHHGLLYSLSMVFSGSSEDEGMSNTQKHTWTAMCSL